MFPRSHGHAVSHEGRHLKRELFGSGSALASYAVPPLAPQPSLTRNLAPRPARQSIGPTVPHATFYLEDDRDNGAQGGSWLKRVTRPRTLAMSSQIFTPQQLAGAGKYNRKVLIGNWKEDRNVVEVCRVALW